jgi:hypothetical protein
MILYFKNLFLFFGIVLLLCIISIVVSNKIVENSIAGNSEISVLVLGDSHAQGGIDLDAKIENSINLSASAESYYFSYNKLKYFVEKNRKIKQLVLALGPHNLSKSIDSIWIFDKSTFLDKTRNYWPLICKSSIPEFTDKCNFSKFTYIELVPEIFYQSFYTLERMLLTRKTPFIGGYTPNNKTIIIQASDTLNSKSKKETYMVSEIQTYYLQKIINICNENGIKLVLVNTPLFNGNRLENLPKLTGSYQILDYGDIFNHNKKLFADYVHLNHQGAEIFSDTLVNKLTRN